jgi:hypothetical protein
MKYHVNPRIDIDDALAAKLRRQAVASASPAACQPGALRHGAAGVAPPNGRRPPESDRPGGLTAPAASGPGAKAQDVSPMIAETAKAAKVAIRQGAEPTRSPDRG